MPQMVSLLELQQESMSRMQKNKQRQMELQQQKPKSQQVFTRPKQHVRRRSQQQQPPEVKQAAFQFDGDTDVNFAIKFIDNHVVISLKQGYFLVGLVGLGVLVTAGLACLKPTMQSMLFDDKRR